MGLVGVAAGILVSAAVLTDMSISTTALVETTVIFWLVHIGVQFLALRVLVRQPSVALAGLLAVASTIVSLIIVVLIVSGLTIHGASTYLFATLIIWVTTAVADMIGHRMIRDRRMDRRQERRGTDPGRRVSRLSQPGHPGRQMSMDTEFDIVVVGAGIAGLTAAATATRGGARTLVLEAHRPGGRARTTEREGFVLNLGAHALYRKGAGGRVLADLGISPAGTAPPLGRYRGSLAGALHRLPTGPGSLLRSTLLGTRSKVQLGGLLARMPRMDPAALSGTSVRAWLDDIGLRPDADAVVLALLRLSTYCPDVDRFGADAALTQLQIAAAGGVRYLDGGWSRLVDSLGAGTELRASAAVRALEPAAGRVEVRTDDGPVVARQVVVAVGPPAAARALLPEPPDWGELGGPVTAACLDLGVRTVPSPGTCSGSTPRCTPPPRALRPGRLRRDRPWWASCATAPGRPSSTVPSSRSTADGAAWPTGTW